jgi:hypothetical protein
MSALRSLCLRAALTTLFASLLPPAQASDSTDTADDMKLPRELLMDGLNARVKPLNFSIPAGTAKWDVKLMRLNDDAFFVNYTIGGGAPFQVQAIICNQTVGGTASTRVDATMLGPTETAGEFYDTNLTYAFYPPDVTPPCMLKFMNASIQNGWVKHDWEEAKRDAYFTTSHERAFRHMVNWVQYLVENRGDGRRAAQFLTVALEHEAEQLRPLAAGSNLEDAVHHLALLEQILPGKVLDQPPPLVPEQTAAVGRFLQLRLRLQQKLAVFIANSATLIQRDQALLRKFGVAQ